MRKFLHVFLLAPKEMGSETPRVVAAADDPERLLAGAGAGSGGLRAGEACSRTRPTGRAVVDAPLVVAVLAAMQVELFRHARNAKDSGNPLV